MNAHEEGIFCIVKYSFKGDKLKDVGTAWMHNTPATPEQHEEGRTDANDVQSYGRGITPSQIQGTEEKREQISAI